jgi:ATP-dependent helicase HrpA
VAAELVETTRLFGRGLAAIEPQWIPPIAGHLLKTQLLEPHWEKKAGEVVALERATLYGIVVYNNRRVNYAKVDPAAAREIFIREALVNGLSMPETRSCPSWRTTSKLVREVEEPGAQVAPAGRAGRRRADLRLLRPAAARPRSAAAPTLERWFRDEVTRRPRLLQLSRDELMRHEAAGITTTRSRAPCGWAASTAPPATCTSPATRRTA